MYKKQNLPELTLRGLILGSILTIIFTASECIFGVKSGTYFFIINSSCGHLHGGFESF